MIKNKHRSAWVSWWLCLNGSDYGVLKADFSMFINICHNHFSGSVDSFISLRIAIVSVLYSIVLIQSKLQLRFPFHFPYSLFTSPTKVNIRLVACATSLMLTNHAKPQMKLVKG